MEQLVTAHISTQAVRTNLRLLRSVLAPGVRLCAVVKANAYGHGIDLLWETIAAEADALAVATAAEAVELRELGYAGTLLVLFSAGACADRDASEDLGELIERDVTLTVVTVAEVEAISRAAATAGKTPAVHVMIDTGMTRSGVADRDAPRLIERIRCTAGLKLTGLYTHLATADGPDKTFAREQLARFARVIEACGGRAGLILHAANSAATIDLGESHFDMVRPGLSVYGYQPYAEVTNRLPLRPAMRVTAPLMQVKDVQPGQRCGYGLTYRFERRGRVGLVPIGYADGYFRSYSNRATMRVAGRDVPVRGRVSMDQTIIDLTNAPEVKVGDEVEIISNDPAAPNSVQALAKLAATIPQEVTSNLGRRVRRVPCE